MVAFIKQEANEKAHEILIKAGAPMITVLTFVELHVLTDGLVRGGVQH